MVFGSQVLTVEENSRQSDLRGTRIDCEEASLRARGKGKGTLGLETEKRVRNALASAPRDSKDSLECSDEAHSLGSHATRARRGTSRGFAALLLDERRSLADALREKRGEVNLCIQGVDRLLNRGFRLLRNEPKEREHSLQA